jgi:16S rRNA (adenine1518-N6/adenine1519-N6)-dimethyltransferase
MNDKSGKVASDQTDLGISNNQIDSLPSLRDLVGAMDMRARKSLGQNFLFDLNLTRRIARSAAPLTGTTIEIGPGPGGLTRALLLEGATRLVAIEKDWRAPDVLASLLSAANGRLELTEADAMDFPIWNLEPEPRRIVANLPYNIATTLLIRWLEHAANFESMTLMFQREVALRITAKPGDSAYGRLSVLSRMAGRRRDFVRYSTRSFCSCTKDYIIGCSNRSPFGAAIYL